MLIIQAEEKKSTTIFRRRKQYLLQSAGSLRKLKIKSLQSERKSVIIYKRVDLSTPRSI